MNSKWNHVCARIMFGLLGVATVASARTIHVDAQATGLSYGTSWPSAFVHLQDALEAAREGDEIHVAAGVYRPDQGASVTEGDREASFVIDKVLSIKGGYAGVHASDPDIRDMVEYETILSGDLEGNDQAYTALRRYAEEPTRQDNSSVVVTISFVQEGLIEALTIQGGHASGFRGGGGVFVGHARIHMEKCKLMGNYSGGNGGGLYNSAGDPELTNCSFWRNQARQGSGVYSQGGQPVFRRCLFIDNVSSYTSTLVSQDKGLRILGCTFHKNTCDDWRGTGGASLLGTQSLVQDCLFSENAGGRYGGGLHVAGEAVIQRSQFIGNQGREGGAIYSASFSRSVDIMDCLFEGNHSTHGGGAIHADGYLAVGNCRFVRNNSDDHWGAGAIQTSFSSTLTATICNSVFAGNTSVGSAGAINLARGNCELANCVFYANSAGPGKGALYTAKNATASVINSIFWENTERPVAGESIEISYSNIQGGWPGSMNIETDPCFVDTSSEDPLLWDFHLKPDSLCIDAGGNVTIDMLSFRDPDGIFRRVDGDGDGNSAVDMGVYEYPSDDPMPAVAVHPKSVSYDFEGGSRDVQAPIVTVVNGGQTAVHWEMATDDPVPWLQLIPDQGKLMPNEGAEVRVVVNREQVDPGIDSQSINLWIDSMTTVMDKVELSFGNPQTHYVPSEYATIQEAIMAALRGDRIVVAPGVYHEAIHFWGQDIILTSTDPEDPNVVANTVIDALGEFGPVVAFSGIESPDCGLYGFTITGGFSGEGNGGIYGNSAHATISNCVIRNNHGENGAGISSCDGTISNCLIKNNYAYDNGGGLSYCDGTIVGCTIKDNVAEDGAGLDSCHGAVLNCLIVGNRASDDGAALRGCHATIQNCTIVGNWAGDDSVIYGCTADILNCIIWGNIIGDDDDDGFPVYLVNSSMPQYSCYEGAQGQGNIDCDPCFVANGYWEDGKWISGDYHLRSDSPCLDAGLTKGQNSLDACYDLEGRARVIDSQGNGDLSVDMGCYEFFQDSSIASPWCVFPDPMALSAGQGVMSIATKALTVFAPTAWTAMTDCNWLSVMPVQGTSSVGPDYCVLTVDSNGLESGDHEAVYEIHDTEGDHGSYRGVVTLAVSASSFVLPSQPIEVQIFNDQDTMQSQSVTLYNRGLDPVQWSAPESQHRIRVTPSQGELEPGQSHEVAIEVNAEGLSLGEHWLAVALVNETHWDEEAILWIHVVVTKARIFVPGDYPTLQQAVDVAGHGSEVIVADGTYTGQYNKNIDFKGKAVALRSQNGPAHCTIDCEQTGRAAIFQNDEGPESVLDGFTIINGNASFGGGILCLSASPTIRNCIILDCEATGGGGAIACRPLDYDEYTSGPRVINCKMMGNQALSGGGVYLEGVTDENRHRICHIINCLIASNAAMTGEWPESGGRPDIGTGGGLSIWNRMSPIIYNCTIVTNHAVGSDDTGGGGIYSYRSSYPTILSSIVANNQAEVGWGNVDGPRSARYSNIIHDWIGAGEGNISEDPRFMNPLGPDNIAGTKDDDYRLSTLSPCVNSGTPDVAHIIPSYDLGGGTRIQMGRIDMGAYEFDGVIYVDDNAKGDPGAQNHTVNDPDENGSEVHPFDSIQHAIDAAHNGSKIIVMPGVYVSYSDDSDYKINFLGKSIVLTSIAPTDPTMIQQTVLQGSITFSGTESNASALAGFAIRNARYGAVEGNHTHATLSHCQIVGNGTCDGTVISDFDGLIENCLIADNFLAGYCGLFPVLNGINGTLRNCTIAYNDTGVLVGSALIENCILYGNEGVQLAVLAGSDAHLRYTNIEGGQDGIAVEGSLAWGAGNRDVDPCFVRHRSGSIDSRIEGDYHLKSMGWRWSPVPVHGSNWIYDAQTSACIDAGDPSNGLGEELLAVPDDPENIYGENRVINMGAYGGTYQASLMPKYVDAALQE